MAGAAFGDSTTTYWPLMPSVFWLSIMPPNIFGKRHPPGGMVAPNKPKSGASNPAINCARVRRMPSSLT
jgi:hypothetical protein